MKKIAVWSTIGALLFFTLIFVFMAIGISNTEKELRNQCVAQQKSNEATFDKVWKVIQQKAGIMNKQRDDFKAVYVSIMSERYQGETSGAPAFKWITENNPQFPMDMYKDVSDAIESNRAEFLRVQKRLIDIKREHDNLRMKFPSSLVVGSRPALEIQVVTSSKTQRIFSSGQENEEDLEL